MGEERFEAGRIGDFSSKRLAEKIKSIGLSTGRLKTGTPARLSSKSINWNKLEMQYPKETNLFLFYTKNRSNGKLTVITYTNKTTHEIISSNIEKSWCLMAQLHPTDQGIVLQLKTK